MRRDDGMTLIELTVSMVLMSIFMAMFTGAIVMLTSAMNTSQGINDAATEVNTAFTQLDEIVRAAAYVSTPGKSAASGNWYVELRTTYTGTETCTQLRLDRTTQQLQRRTWTVVNSVPSPVGVWRPIASGFSNGAAVAGASTQPFALVATAGTSKLFQQLVVTLVPPVGPGRTAATAGSSFTVTALNSTLPVPTASICQQQGRP